MTRFFKGQFDNNPSQSGLTRLRFLLTGFSVCALLVSVLMIGIKGFNWGLDFTGGVVTEVTLDSSIELTELNQHVDNVLAQDVQVIKASEEGQWILRYSDELAGDVGITDALAQISEQVTLISHSIVGPQVGNEMVEQGGLAVLVCLVMIMVYLSMRFDWRLASGALLALMTDIIIVLGVFAVLQLEFNLTVLAALLAVLGYSLNDSIIIADRVREIMRMRPKGDTNEIINEAVKATFSRTLVTSGTTLVTVSSLWLLAGASLQGFSIALFVGIICGTCSSIALGVTLPQLFGLKPADYIPQPIDIEETYS
ncbi:protein translocase subunit SecF [Shewanella sp. 1_MG-2023]|uniref:protein translocase subunit SecF n=1 Tax=unclassified Shewanella TaxID=196818 RepID=UPI0026E1AE2B|nr:MULTISPECIES: protein translocase subunit SecF [unclassified Shewanella]MDO6612261.1 protein translocase subunit SecF [Shewanella sp. 7_MG-2023]MDO6772115.1 protein translocase subunit SecF [Shewanella sp. 2_MG-2023]MDO6796080.1 protein translocase subunit SecF [Shewanella sp. 1_MG-2023]